jgi:hypothetical protein
VGVKTREKIYITPRWLNKRGTRMRTILIVAMTAIFSHSVFAEPVRVVVPGNQAWTQTDIVLKEGDKVVISATGTISNNVTDTGRNPDGNSAKFKNDKRNWNPLPEANDISLIGKIGDVLLPIGSHREFKSPASGILFLGVNDKNASDNQGAWKVDIAVEERAKDKENSSEIDLLKEYENEKWKDLLNRGKWEKDDGAYELVGESGGGSDIGWSYPLNGIDTFTISMTFRMANAGAIQIVFTEKPQMIQGFGVALSYAWNKGFSVGNLDSRGKDMKTVELSRINKGWHELEIKVNPSSISAKLDNGEEVSWRGNFSPTCVLLSGDEHGDWYIKKLALNKEKSTGDKDKNKIEPKSPMPKKEADKDSKK